MTINHEFANEAIDAAASLLATVDVIAMETELSNQAVLDRIMLAACMKHAEGILATRRERAQMIR